MAAPVAWGITALAAMVFPYTKRDLYERLTAYLPNWMRAKLLGVPMLSIGGTILFLGMAAWIGSMSRIRSSNPRRYHPWTKNPSSARADGVFFTSHLNQLLHGLETSRRVRIGKLILVQPLNSSQRVFSHPTLGSRSVELPLNSPFIFQDIRRETQPPCVLEQRIKFGSPLEIRRRLAGDASKVNP